MQNEATPNTRFRFAGSGDAYADGAWTTGGADYAEYFEWSDGNPNAEDRRGVSVVLDGAMIRPAASSDAPQDIIGVVSANPSVIGDADVDTWRGRYLTDDFGQVLHEPCELVEWDEEIIETEAHVVRVRRDEGGQEFVLSEGAFPMPGDVEITLPAKTRAERRAYHADRLPEGVTPPTGAVTTPAVRPLSNPAYDPDIEYLPRSSRPEWAAIGLIGKLRIRQGQPVRPGWIKTRTVSDQVAEWLVR